MADGGMVKRDGAGSLVSAAEGRVPWTSSQALRPLAIAGTAGGLYVAVARWQASKWFKGTDGTDATGARWKRGGVVALVSLGVAMVVKRWSVAAAVGIALAGVAYGALEILDDPDGPFHVARRLESWRTNTGTGSGTGTGTGTGGAAGMRRAQAYG